MYIVISIGLYLLLDRRLRAIVSRKSIGFRVRFVPAGFWWLYPRARLKSRARGVRVSAISHAETHRLSSGAIILQLTETCWKFEGVDVRLAILCDRATDCRLVVVTVLISHLSRTESDFRRPRRRLFYHVPKSIDSRCHSTSGLSSLNNAESSAALVPAMCTAQGQVRQKPPLRQLQEVPCRMHLCRSRARAQEKAKASR